MLILTRPCYALVVLIVAIAGVNGPLHANEPPPIPSRWVSSGSPFTASQRHEVETYARHWCDHLMSGEPAKVFRARQELLDPLRSPGLRMVFRDEYSRIAVPMLREVLEARQSTLGAINALQVAGGLGTERALRLAVDHADPANEPRKEVRLWAAQAFRITLEEESVETRRLTPFVRDLSRAAVQEDDWMVLSRHFETLARVNTNYARERSLLVLEAAVELAGDNENGPADVMRAIRVGVLTLREQFLDIGSEEQRSLGRELGRILGKVIAIPMDHWDTAREDEQHKRTYQGVIQMCESMLRIIEGSVRGSEPPRTNLEGAWGNGDRDRFQQDLDRWQSILTSPPYVG